MAEKGFGVKEINLIGASGTPTIESPNNLNLNAVNVAISTNVSIGGTLSVTGNVSVGGTLTYEDVTNIDSVGLITARSGLIISGVTTFNTDVDFKGSGGGTKILFDASQDQLELADSTALTFGNHTGTGDYNISYVNGADFTILGMNGGSGDLVLGTFALGTTTKTLVSKRSNNALELYFANNKKLETTNTGIDVTGAITVNGSALSITPTTSDIQGVYEITNQTSNSYYRFAGNGVDSSANNPDLYLERGKKYRFINNSGGNHPFRIQSDNSSTLYSTGVTNNNASTGNIDFAIRWDAPSHLYYKCGNHGAMLGNIYLTGGSSDIKMADQWRRTATLNTNNAENFITTDWARVSGGGLGTFVDNGGMTESGGIFTFPRTGIYLVTWQAYAETSSISRSNAVNIYVTTDNSSYNNRAASVFSMEYDMTSYIYGGGHCSAMIDVTDTSQVKVKFRVYSSGNVAWDVSSTQNRNCATFIRMGDT